MISKRNMTNNVIFDYFELRRQEITNGIALEIDFYKKCKHYDISIVSEYVDYLEQRTGQKKKVNLRENTETEQEYQKIDMNNHYKSMEVVIYRKPWSKLRDQHKNAKINEYVESLFYDKNIVHEDIITVNKNKLKKTLCSEGVDKKLFIKDSSIIKYNQDAMKIESINCVVLLPKGTYDVKWKKT